MLQNPELQIEEEFKDLVYFGEDCTPISTPFLYKKFKRNAHRNKVSCKGCNEATNGIREGSMDCPYCLGAGYEWEQGIAKGWFSKPEFSIERTLIASISDKSAESSFTKLFLYTSKDIELGETDIILVPELNGTKIKLPIVSRGIFSIFDDFNYKANATEGEYNRYRLNTTFDPSFDHLLSKGGD